MLKLQISSLQKTSLKKKNSDHKNISATHTTDKGLLSTIKRTLKTEQDDNLIKKWAKDFE